MTDKLIANRPQRILHIGKYFPPHRGGMETVLRDQMNMQARDEGLVVSAVVHSSERRLKDTVEVTELGYRVRRSARWFTAVFAPISPFFWWSVLREIRELDPDEIKIHMPNLSAFWLLLLPSAWTRKWVILWHSDVLPSQHSFGLRCCYWLYAPFETLLLSYADHIIATSPPYFEFSKPLKRFRRKCVVEPLRLDKHRIPTQLLSAPQPARGPREGVRVLCVGRLTYYKGFDTAIEAIALTSNAQLRIVGDGDLRQSLEKKVQTLGIGDRVRFMGEADDELLWTMYAWSDVVCLPSIERTEAFGLVLLEANTFNKPAFVSDLKGSGVPWVAKHVISDGKCFPTGNPCALAELLQAAGEDLSKQA